MISDRLHYEKVMTWTDTSQIKIPSTHAKLSSKELKYLTFIKGLLVVFKINFLPEITGSHQGHYY